MLFLQIMMSLLIVEITAILMLLIFWKRIKKEEIVSVKRVIAPTIKNDMDAITQKRKPIYNNDSVFYDKEKKQRRGETP